MDEFVEVTIYKPIHSNFCSIDKRKLDEANSTGRLIKITIVGVGTAIVDPQWWWNTAVKKEKRVVNYINKPMVFVYNYAPMSTNFKVNKDLSDGQLQIF